LSLKPSKRYSDLTGLDKHPFDLPLGPHKVGGNTVYVHLHIRIKLIPIEPRECGGGGFPFQYPYLTSKFHNSVEVPAQKWTVLFIRKQWELKCKLKSRAIFRHHQWHEGVRRPELLVIPNDCPDKCFAVFCFFVGFRGPLFGKAKRSCERNCERVLCASSPGGIVGPDGFMPCLPPF